MRLFASLVTEVGRDFIPGDIAVMQKKGICFGQIETESTEEPYTVFGLFGSNYRKATFFFFF